MFISIKNKNKNQINKPNKALCEPELTRVISSAMAKTQAWKSEAVRKKRDSTHTSHPTLSLSSGCLYSDAL